MKFTLLAASAAVASAQRLFTVGTSANGATANLRNDGTFGCYELQAADLDTEGITGIDGSISLDVSGASCNSKRCPDCYIMKNNGLDSPAAGNKPTLRLENCNKVCTSADGTGCLATVNGVLVMRTFSFLCLDPDGCTIQGASASTSATVRANSYKQAFCMDTGTSDLFFPPATWDR